jgi:hypothetical protein
MVTGNNKRHSKGNRVDRGAKRQSHLLPGGERDSIAEIRGIECRHDPEYSLLFLLLDLLFSLLALC